MPQDRAKTVFLHIGLHKSGTTYLQGVLRANRAALAAEGVHFPGGPGQPVHTFAVYDLFGRRPRGSGDDRISGQWQAMTELVLADPAPVSLLSEEATSLASPKQARAAVESFPGCEVHVVVTARDLARVALSAWQEDVKSDETWTWRAWADAVANPGRRATAPGRGFWLRQDLPAVLDVWGALLPRHRVHVVTVPPPGTPRTELLGRFASVAGFDAAALREQPSWDNPSTGVTGTEVLRRMNERMHRRLNQRQYHDVVEVTLAPILAAATNARLRLPDEDRGWVEVESRRIRDAVRQAGYRVVGDLDDLAPQITEDGRDPGTATDPELLDTALQALAGLTEAFGKARWARPAASLNRVPARGRAGGAGSTARSLAFRGKRAAVNVADRNQAVAKGLAWFLRVRTARTRRRARP
ncbi:MAG: hypothetical protein ACRDP1_01680 [Nocardioidaceae bacterium]